MIKRIQILDDVFSKEILDEILQFTKADVTPHQYSLKEIGVDTVPTGIQHIFDFVSDIYELKDTKFLEYWKHHNTSPRWHYDCDEVYLRRTGNYSFALNTIIFYPEIELLQGGELITETIRITPITNRMVILSPGIWHKVDDIVSGSRMSLNINPWHYKIETSQNSHI